MAGTRRVIRHVLKDGKGFQKQFQWMRALNWKLACRGGRGGGSALCHLRNLTWRHGAAARNHNVLLKNLAYRNLILVSINSLI